MFLSSLKLRVSYSDILGDTSHLLSCSFPSHSCSPSIHHTSVLAPCSLQGQSAQADWLTALSSKPLQEAALRTRAMFSAWNSDLSAVIQNFWAKPASTALLPSASGELVEQWWEVGGTAGGVLWGLTLTSRFAHQLSEKISAQHLGYRIIEWLDWKIT